MRSIRESEMELDYWNHSLTSLRQAQQAEGIHKMEDSLSSLHLAAHSDLVGKGQWQQVPAQRSRPISSVTTPPSQVPLYNRYEALKVQANNTEEYGSSGLEMSPRSSRPMPCIKTFPTKKNKQTSCCHWRLPSEGNRRPNIQTGPTS